MAVDEGFTVDCAVGSREQVADGLRNLRIANEIVLEMTAIGTLALLNIESVLKNLGTQVVVSQATINELTEMITRDELETGEGGFVSRQGDQPVYIRRDAQEHQNHIKRLKALLDTIRSCARVIPAREAIALEPERRKVLDSAFGHYGTEAILLAGHPVD